MEAHFLLQNMIRPSARELVMTYGWNATTYLILNPGISHWFDSSTPAVVGYLRRGRMMLVAGGPVCPPEALPWIVQAFERFAREQDCGVCYVYAEERLRQLLHQSRNHSAVRIGLQPVWDPRQWRSVVASHRRLRKQLNWSRNKGIEVEAVAPEAPSNARRVREVLADWLKTRSLPPLHFLAEPEALEGVVADRLLLVARHGGQVVAYLVACPIVLRNGYLIEHVPSPQAPNGTSELLIDTAMRRFADEGRAYATLGLVVAANHDHSNALRNPAWLRGLMRLARICGNHLYNFRGLEAFRGKMAPDRWDPIYVISNGARFTPRTFYTVESAFFGMMPWRALATGAARVAARPMRRVVTRAEALSARALNLF